MALRTKKALPCYALTDVITCILKNTTVHLIHVEQLFDTKNLIY